MDKLITVDDLRHDEEVQLLLKTSENQLEAMGYTEHSLRHVSLVSKRAGQIIKEIGGSEREIRLAEIAGYLHDIGNAINREDHGQSGAILAYTMLKERKQPLTDCAEILIAIGNHNEREGFPVSRIASALILADKSDVDRSRVRKNVLGWDKLKSDIHDRVNYAATGSNIKVDSNRKAIIFEFTIDIDICSVMDYFEIFIKRMKLCEVSAKYLGYTFELYINGQKVA